MWVSHRKITSPVGCPQENAGSSGLKKPRRLTSDYLFYIADLIMLGEFEYLLITAAAGLGDGAYGAAIREEIESTTGRKCSIGALYTTVDRLEAKGLLTTWMGDATPERGGRAKRMVQVTPEGVKEAKAFYNMITQMSRRASWVIKRNGGTP